MTQEVAGINSSFSLSTHKQFNRQTSLLTLCIQEGQEKGEIIDVFPASELAEYMQSTLFGVLAVAKSERSVRPLELWYKITFNFISK